MPTRPKNNDFENIQNERDLGHFLHTRNFSYSVWRYLGVRTVLQGAPTRSVEVGASKVVGQEFSGRVELNERENN